MFIFQHAHRGITYNRMRIEIQQTTDYTKRHAKPSPYKGFGN